MREIRPYDLVHATAHLEKILYISYDGLTDPLGQSQILPYVIELSKAGYRFTILSFEKHSRFEKNRRIIKKLTCAAEINWEFLRFTTKPPLLAKLYDMLRLRRKVLRLHRRESFDMVHCRGYLSADIGLELKKKFNVKLFFDMRGFWPDEKRDSGAWNQKHLLFRWIYQYYKQKERQFIKKLDCIVSLSEAGKKEILNWESYNPSRPLEVIPCCVDMDLFSVVTPLQRSASRSLLGIRNGRLVLSYLGSVGCWYMLHEMLILFRYVKTQYADALFLFVTPASPETILAKVDELNLRRDDVVIVEASRQEVPMFIKASDLSVSFIQPFYSKISSSPTKMAEVLAIGIPVITNSGVGDVKQIIESANAGFVIDKFSEDDYLKVVAQIPVLLQLSADKVRASIQHVYSLERAIILYRDLYAKMFSIN